jgi:hypothetical protein
MDERLHVVVSVLFVLVFGVSNLEEVLFHHCIEGCFLIDVLYQLWMSH